jgi:very-short-patch-repair endonuclease
MRKEQTLAAIARGQAGVFSRRQAIEAGFTRHEFARRLTEGTWRALLPRVYCLAASPPADNQQLWAACLWAGAGAVVSHRSAGAVWNFDGVIPRKPEFWVPYKCTKRRPDVITRRSDSVPPLDGRYVRGLRVTSPERTLLDLASVLDELALEIAFESARRERLVTIESVQRCLERSGGHGRRGTASLRTLLRQVRDAPSESPLEVKMARLLRRSKLPRPVQQFEVGSYRLDFAWPDELVALECDGRLRHSEDSDFQHDRTKLTDLASDGWRVLIATRADVNDALVAKLERALTAGVLPLVRRRGRRSTS